MRSMTTVEAQNHFGELLDIAQREPVTITQSGRSVAFVVSVREMEEIIDIRKQRIQSVEMFESYFTESDCKLKPHAKLLTDEDINRMVHELR